MNQNQNQNRNTKLSSRRFIASLIGVLAIVLHDVAGIELSQANIDAMTTLIVALIAGLSAEDVMRVVMENWKERSEVINSTAQDIVNDTAVDLNQQLPSEGA